jgi:hypothetical protein
VVVEVVEIFLEVVAPEVLYTKLPQQLVQALLTQ